MSAYKDAIELFVQALKKTPEGVSPLSMLGSALLKMGKNEKALEVLNLAVQSNGNNALAYRMLGNGYETLGLHQDAIDAYRQAREIDGNDIETHIAMGVVFQKMHRMGDAINSLNQALSIQPDSQFALYQKGLCHIGLRDINGARKQYTTLRNLGDSEYSRKLVEQMPDILPQSETESAPAQPVAPVVSEESARMLAEYKERLKNSPFDAELYYNMGVLLKDMGKSKDAIQALNLALKFNPQQFKAEFEKGLSYIMLSDVSGAQKAVESLRAAGQHQLMMELENKVADLAARLERGEKPIVEAPKADHYTSHEFSNAFKEPLHETEELPPTQVVVQQTHSAVNIEDKERQILEYKNTIKNNPFDGGTYLRMGIAYHDIGKIRDALTSYNLAIRFQPDLTEAKYRKTLALIEQNNTDAAAKSFDEFRGANPEYDRDIERRLSGQTGGAPVITAEVASRAPQSAPPAAQQPASAPPVAPVEAPPPPEPVYEEPPRPTDPQAELEASKEEIKTNPYDAHAYLRLGLAYEKLQRYADAITGFNLALQFTPDLAVAIYHKGLCHLALGDEDLSAQEYNKLLKSGNDDFAKKLNEAFKQSKQEKSKQTATPAVKSKYGDPDDPNDVIESCKRIIKQDPYDPDAYHHMGLAYKAMEKYQDAINSFSLAVKAKDNYFEADYERGLCYLKLGQEDKALSIYTSLLKDDQKELAKQLFDLFLMRLK